MISRIIEARPDDLRVFLEEAAGVTRYKERRKETNGRLEDSRENLTRVEDIRLELGNQIEKLGVQAEVARRYHALNEELVQRQQVLWLLKKREADAERQRDITIANAYKDAQIIKGEGDAQAAALYASTFGKDPQFAKFYKSLDTYKATFAKKSDVMVIDTSSEFFKVMRGNASTDASAGAAGAKSRK